MTDTTYLEHALIGALLNQPHHATALAQQLSEADFTDPLCQALWAVLTSQPRWAHEPVNVLHMANRVGTVSELHVKRRSPSAIAELQTQAPARPHLRTYAQLLAEATTRRHIQHLGYQLAAIDPARPDQTLARIDAIATQLEQIRTTHARTLDGLVACDQPAAVAPAPAPAEKPRIACAADQDQLFAETSVLGAVIHDHPTGCRADALAAITPSDLTHPPYRLAWAAAADLHAATMPVDEITVHWQLQRLATEPAQLPSLQDLRESRWAASDYDQAAAHLLNASSARAVRRLQNTLTQLETAPRLTPALDCVEQAERQLRQQTQRRLQQPASQTDARSAMVTR